MAQRHTGRQWFDVDPAGLKQILARRGHGFIVHELIQNAWDAGAKNVGIVVSHEKEELTLSVTDDALSGVEDLADLYTLFKPSAKKKNPQLRGRFNAGEKLAISCAQQARVTTVKGTIYFRRGGDRAYSAIRRLEVGTQVVLTFPYSSSIASIFILSARQVIPPPDVETTLTANGHAERLDAPKRVWFGSGFKLPTEIERQDGSLGASERQTTVTMLDTAGTQAWVHELGIPVCPIELPWHVDVFQKIPLTIDRSNVTGAFLRRLSVALLNRAHKLITTQEMATATWVREAAADPACCAEATEHLTRLRFGERAVIFDPSDPEANMRAVSEGYTVIHGGALSAGEWKNLKGTDVVKPAGQVTGTVMAFGGADSAGKTLDELDPEQLSERERGMAEYLKWLCTELIGSVTIRFYRDRQWDVIAACSADRTMVVNLGRFRWWQRDELHGVVLHELAHVRESNHLSEEYHRELARLGARLADVASKNFRVVQAWVTPVSEAQAASRDV